MKKIIYLLCLTQLMMSCMTLKPDSDKVYKQDYNSRVKIDNPHYVKKPSKEGKLLNLAGVLVGASSTYAIAPIKRNSETGPANANIANIAVGALIGLSAGLFLNYKGGQHEKVYSGNFDDWIDSTNPSYTDYKGPSTVFERWTIPKRTEYRYLFKTEDDMIGFDKTFPKSQYLNTNLNKSLNSMNWNVKLIAIKRYKEKMNPEIYMSYSESLFYSSYSVTQLNRLIGHTAYTREEIIAQSYSKARSFKAYKLMFSYYPGEKETIWDYLITTAEDFSEFRFLQDHYFTKEKRVKIESYALIHANSFDKAIAFSEVFPEYKEKGAKRARNFLENCSQINQFDKSYSEYSKLISSSIRENCIKQLREGISDIISIGASIGGLAAETKSKDFFGSIGERASRFINDLNTWDIGMQIIWKTADLFFLKNKLSYSEYTELISACSLEHGVKYGSDVKLLMGKLDSQQLLSYSKDKIHDTALEHLEELGYKNLKKQKKLLSYINCVLGE